MPPEQIGPTSNRTLDLPPEGRYGLIGREAEAMRLEHDFERVPVVLLTGASGVGKTELACSFARRVADKAQAPGGVLFTSFDYGAGLCRLIHEIGTTLRGLRFASLSQEAQLQWVTSYLNRNPCLLAWDNFDNVFHYLEGQEIQEIVDFLQDIAGGPSRVLITARGIDWIELISDRGGLVYAHEQLKELDGGDARQLASAIMDGASVDAGGLGPGYSELMGLLRGNPMCMRVVLPHLRQRTPSELANVLAGFDRQGDQESQGLDAALNCSFSLLSPRTREHLPFLAMFRQRVILDVLTFITQGEVYVSVMHEEMGWGACRTFLREARDCGIIDSIPPSVFLIPSSVRRFLQRKLGERLTRPHMDILQQELVRVYADLGDYFMENLSSENTESTVTGVLAEEANLLHALDLAETGGEWEYVQLILQPLAQVYKMQERVPELRRLRTRLLAQVGREPRDAQQKGAIDLWMYLQGTEVNDAISRMELDRAEGICDMIMTYLKSSGDSSAQLQIASTYHNLGLIAQARNEHRRAEEWYHRALEINEALGNEAEAADSYHQLGLLGKATSQYEIAESWFRKALEGRQSLSDETESANECHELGLVAEAGYKFQDASEWYRRALATFERVGDEVSAASVYHRLGLMSQARYDYEEATAWYQRALLAYEKLEDEVGGASDLYQLGMIALQRHEYEEAEKWLRQALEAYELLEDEAGLANCYHHLGVAAHAQRRHQEAEERYRNALNILARLGDEETAAITWGQLGLLADQRGNYPEAVWYVAHTYEIAAAHQLPLIRQARTHLSNLRSKMGTDAFVSCWREISDTDVLSELG